MNYGKGACGPSGRMCPAAKELDDSLSKSLLNEFGRNIEAESSPLALTPDNQDGSYSPYMPSGMGTRVIKRTKVTRTSSDPDDPELQGNRLFRDSPGMSMKSHGSSGPDSYNSYQGYHQSIPIQNSIPPMYRTNHPKNYDDTSAPALIRTDRGMLSPKSPGYPFPSSPVPDSPTQLSRPTQNQLLYNNSNRSYNSGRSAPRSAYSSGYAPNVLGTESMPAAYGRVYDPSRVSSMKARRDNQTAPAALYTSVPSRGGGRQMARGNESSPEAYGRPQSPARLQDPWLQNQSASGALTPNSSRRTKTSEGSSGYDASRSTSLKSSPPQTNPYVYPPYMPWIRQQSPCEVDQETASYYTSEGSVAPNALGASVPWSPRQAGQFSYSSPSRDATYYTSNGSSSAGANSSYPFSPRFAGHVTGFTNTDPKNYASSSGSQAYGSKYNSSNFRTPSPKYLSNSSASQENDYNYADMSGGYPPGEIIPQSMQRSMNMPNVSGRDRNVTIPPSKDYFSLIDDGNLAPTSKKKTLIRKTTSAGSVVSEECEEVYDIPEDMPPHVTGQTGINPVNELNSSYMADFFNPTYTSSPNYKAGIEPPRRGMPYYVGRSDRPAPRGDQSSTLSDSFFRVNDPTPGVPKKAPCCCKKKGAKNGKAKDGQESKCEDIGNPCKEKKSQLSHRSGEGGTTDDEPVNVFQAGRYDMDTAASATHSVSPATGSKSCICKGVSGNLSVDLERIEQEEFTQLSRNLSQWQQSRRKVMSNMDSAIDANIDYASCDAKCSNPKK